MFQNIHQIVLLDNEKLALFVHKKLLQSAYPDAYIKVFTCSNELVHFIVSNPTPTLILSDFHMPQKTGLEVFKLLTEEISSELHKMMQFYLLSSDTSLVGVTEKINHLMFKGYLPKPLTKSKVESLIL